MFEVELKVRCDHDRVRETLAELGVELDRARAQTDTYFNAPNRDFATTDEALRIRRSVELEDPIGSDIETAVTESTAQGQATVTYKGPRIDETSKTREEIETAVGDGEALVSILEELGFESVGTVTKIREIGEVDGYTIALDRVAGLGEFVEVERTVPEDSIDTARAGARSCLRELSLDPADGIQTSYLELLLES